MDTTYSTQLTNNEGGGQTTVYTPNAPAMNGTPTSITPSTPTNPVIPTSTLTSTPTLNLPQNAPSSGSAPAAANVATASALNDNQKALLGAADAGVSQATDSYNQEQGSLQGLIGQYLGQGQDELNMENSAGIPGLRTSAANLTTQYNAQNAAYNAQYNDVLNRPGGTLAQKAQEINSLQQQNGYNLTNTAVQQSIAQNDYTNAMNVVTNQIQIKYAPLKDAIDYGMQFLANNKDILTSKQSQQFQAQIAVQNQQYTQGTYYAQLNATTGMDMIKTAAANGADSDTLNAMSTAVTNGASIADVATASNGTLQTGNYSLQYNPSTQQMGVLNANTGKFTDGSSNGTGPVVNATDPDSVNTVTAPDGSTYNFAASGYNTADPNYGTKLTAATSSISSEFGAVSTAVTAQAVLNKYAPTTSLTGQMVITAAQQNGVDPTVLLAQIKEESGCGASNVALNNNNYGGISYVGQQNATQGTARPSAEGGYYAKFATPQDGINAEAALVAKSKQAPTANTTGQTPTLQQNIQTITALKKSLPSNISSGISYMQSTGDGYLDTSKVTDLPGAPAGLALTQAESYAKQYGLAVLTGSQASAMQDADTALTQINNIQAAWNAVAPTTSKDASLKGFGNTIDMLRQDSAATDLTAYMNMVPTAISTLNAITGSKRLSTFSATISTDALPTLSNPVSRGDTLALGNAKLDDMRKDINASITPIINTSQGAPLTSSFATIRLPDGTVGQIPNSNLQAALKAGAIQTSTPVEAI